MRINRVLTATSCLQNYAVPRRQGGGFGSRRHCHQPDDLCGMEDRHTTHRYHPDLQLLHWPAKSYNLETVRRSVVQILPATPDERCILVSGRSLPQLRHDKQIVRGVSAHVTCVHLRYSRSTQGLAAYNGPRADETFQSRQVFGVLQYETVEL